MCFRGDNTAILLQINDQNFNTIDISRFQFTVKINYFSHNETLFYKKIRIRII